tara:strand:- start:1158 stop:1550 length:393 start_codon:yes stop_codon:yes gene_type:complete
MVPSRYDTSAIEIISVSNTFPPMMFPTPRVRAPIRTAAMRVISSGSELMAVVTVNPVTSLGHPVAAATPSPARPMTHPVPAVTRASPAKVTHRRGRDVVGCVVSLSSTVCDVRRGLHISSARIRRSRNRL